LRKFSLIFLAGDKDFMVNELLNKRKRNLGQGMVELALVLPLFLLLLYGIFEIGRLVFMYSAVLNASRDAARVTRGQLTR